MKCAKSDAARSPGQPRSVKYLHTVLIVWLAMLAVSARADIPVGALRDPRYGLGYLVVTYYPGVTNDGTGDCTIGIQTALNDSLTENVSFLDPHTTLHTSRPLAVFFPPGTYQISNVLQCYKWYGTNVGDGVKGFYRLIGSTAGVARPVIKLKAGAAHYQSANAPRQMISFRVFRGDNGSAVPQSSWDPMGGDNAGVPPGYTENQGVLFFDELRNIDFDCGGNPGAVGVVFDGTQWCAVENVSVTATNAFAGFCELPGAGSCSANIEVVGGQYGILLGGGTALRNLGVWVSSSSGPVLAGVQLRDQTVAAMWLSDPVSPPTVVGFQITNSKSVIAVGSAYGSQPGTMTLLDGQIGINSSTNLLAIDNSAGKNIYVRNVYVTGTTNLVRSGTNTTTGSGAWSRIAEYSYNDTTDVANVPPVSNYSLYTGILESFSLINGQVQDRTVKFPVTPSITTNSSPPPSDLVDRHLWVSFPSYNGATNDPATVVVSTNAGWNNTNDDTAVLQAAIDQASTNNGRVFLPGGHYYLTNTLTLYSNTVLIGAGWEATKIEASPSWKPTSGEVTMIQTIDDARATTTMAWLTVVPRLVTAAADTNYTRFNLVNWRAGGNSLVLGAEMDEPYSYQSTDGQARSVLKYTGNGGGHWYTLSEEGAGEWNEKNPGFRKVKISGTTQPLWFYGFNIEHGMGDIEVEVTNACNVRFLGEKRERAIQNPLMVIVNSTNIAAYGLGAARDPLSGTSGYYEVLGTSTNVLLGTLSVQGPFDTSGGNTVYEALTGLAPANVLWPNQVSLYKRGEIDDTLMFVGSKSPPATPTGLTATRDPAYPSMQIDLFWNSVTNATGYVLQRSTNNGGPYSLLSNTPATTYTDTGVLPGTAYYYVVAASSSSGQSTNSTQVMAATRTNAAPSFTQGGDQTVIAGAGTQRVAGWAISISAGPQDEAGQTLTFLVSNDTSNVFTVQPAISSAGDLTFAPVSRLAVPTTATVTLRLQDNGGTANGGVDTSAPQTFTITVNPSSGASTGDFRSVASGNWSDASIWQTNNGATWDPALAAPTSADGVITIQSPNNVTNDAAVTVDQVVVNAGAQLTVASGIVLTVATSGLAAADLDVFGIVRNSGTITNDTGVIKFESGGKYQHAFTTTAGYVPTSTWASNSTCEITSYTTAGTANSLVSANVGQALYHFTWNCPGQTASIGLAGTVTNVRGNFTVITVANGTSASHRLSLGLGLGQVANIGGDLNLTNVFFIAASSPAGVGNPFPQLNLGGNINLGGANTWFYSAFSGTRTTPNCLINLTNTVSECKVSSGNGSAGFIDNCEQFVWQLKANVTFDMGTNILSCWDFTNFPGSTLKLGNPNGIESDPNGYGNIQAQSEGGSKWPVPGENYFEPNATYVYEGSVPQYTGAGLPSTVANLTIANPAGVTIGSAYDVTVLTAVTGMLSVVTGTLDLGGNNSPIVSGLSGFGTISNGNVTMANSGLGLQPGAAGGAGTLTLAGGTLTFGATSQSRFDLSTSTGSGNDKVVFTDAGSVAGSGSTITINPLATLATADYVLFDVQGSGSVTSDFNQTPAWAGSPPANASSYTVITSGKQVLLHYTAALQQPTFAAPVVSGPNLVLTGTGGSPGGTYKLLTSTNVTLPLASWTPLLTNNFSGTGTFSNAIPIISADPQRFYRLKSP